jgi:hypothetical protein
MKIGISLTAWLAIGLLSAAPSAVARGTGGGFATPHTSAFASPHTMAHSRPAFAGSQRVVHRRVAPHPIPPRRPFIARHRTMERLILIPTPAFTTPVFTTPMLIVVDPVCCG